MNKVLKSLEQKEVFFVYSQLEPSEIQAFSELVEHHSGVLFTQREQVLGLFGHGYLACCAALQFQYLYEKGSKNLFKFLISKRSFSLGTNPLAQHKQDDLASTLDFIKGGEIYFSERLLEDINDSDISYNKTQIFFHEEKLFLIDKQRSFQWNVHSAKEALEKETLFDFTKVPQDLADEDSRVKRVLQSMKNGEQKIELLYDPNNPSLVKARGNTNPRRQALGFENKDKEKKTLFSQKVDLDFLETTKGLYSTVITILLGLLIVGGGIGYYRSIVEDREEKQAIARDIEKSEVLELLRSKPSDQQTTFKEPGIAQGPVAYLTVHSNPQGAQVAINGSILPAKTPTPTIKVKAGKVLRIVVSHPNYQNNIKLLNLDEGERSNLMFQLGEKQ